MSGYFKPMRRKFGIAVLAVACLLMIGWMRSHETIDSLYRPLPGNRGGCSILESEKGSIYWYSTGQTWFDVKLSFPAISSSPVAASSNILTSDDVRWSIKCVGFAIGEIEPPPVSRGRPNRIVWVFSYWSIVIPLTLLSAWLLLSKAAPKKESRITPIVEQP